MSTSKHDQIFSEEYNRMCGHVGLQPPENAASCKKYAQSSPPYDLSFRRGGFTATR